MFGKKLLATVLSLGILSACSMGALAGTVSGTGYSSGDPNHIMGGVDINYSITTHRVSPDAPSVVNKMVFNNICSAPVDCYMDCTVFLNDKVMPRMGATGGDTSYVHDYVMQSVLTVDNVTIPPAVDHIYTFFHYYSQSYGSFSADLTKYGFDY